MSLVALDATTPLFIGDPPATHNDFVIHFDGGAFREQRVGGAGIILWLHGPNGLTLLDTLAVPLFPCPDAAYAETVGAAHAVLQAAKHFPIYRPRRIIIKGDNRPVIDFMNNVGKFRRSDLQRLLTDAQHALAFSLPPLLWSYTPREFNKCADFLAGIARDYAKLSLTADLLPHTLEQFSFPLPPSLTSSFSKAAPLSLSPPSSSFTFPEVFDFPLSVFPLLFRKASHTPALLRYLRALHKGSQILLSLSVLYRPSALDQRGRLYPLAIGAQKLPKHYRALLFGRTHWELDIVGSHYQLFQRFTNMLLGVSLPAIDQLRAMLTDDFRSTHPAFLLRHPTAPKDLPAILLNSSLEATLHHYHGPRSLPSINSSNYFFHSLEHPETLWLKSFTSYILSYHTTDSLIWLHDGIWIAPCPPADLIVAANHHSTEALDLGRQPLLLRVTPCGSLYDQAWKLFQLPILPPPDPPPLAAPQPPPLRRPMSEVDARRGFIRMMRNAAPPRAMPAIVATEVVQIDDDV